jgi:hypothetical protein
MAMATISRRRLTQAAALLMAVAGAVAAVYAQTIWRGGREGSAPPKYPTRSTFVGGFNFCRGIFQRERYEDGGIGWNTDYPGADINLSIRLSELTKTDVTKDEYSELGDPDHVTIKLTDPELFECPFLILEDAGTVVFSNAEVAALRAYLLKGGFILVADYWGTLAQLQFDEQIGRALSPVEYPIVDIPMSHTIWHTQFEVKKVPQVSAIQFWRRNGGAVSERGPDSPRPDMRGILDSHGRIMVLMIHNTDIPDGWEREGEDREFFYNFSPDCYAVGIDVILYALTH